MEALCCRQIVGPPLGTNWSVEWHKMLDPSSRCSHAMWRASVCVLACTPPVFFFPFSWAPQFRTCSKQLGSNSDYDLLLSTQNFGKLGGRCWRATAVGIACGRLHLFLLAMNVFTPVPTRALHFFGVQARLKSIG